MNLTRNIYLAVTFSFLFSLFGCMEYKDVEMVRVQNFGVKNMSAEGVNFTVDMQISNPNNYNINIVGSDMDLYVDNNKVGKAKLKGKVTLPKNSNEVHQFVIATNYTDLSSDPLTIMASVFGGNTMNVEVKGFVKARAKGVSKKFPVEFKERVKL